MPLPIDKRGRRIGGGGGGGFWGQLLGSVLDDSPDTTDAQPNTLYGKQPGDVPYTYNQDPTALTQSRFVNNAGVPDRNARRLSNLVSTEDYTQGVENARAVDMQRQLGELKVKDAVALAQQMNPLDIQRALGMTYANKGMFTTPENIASTTGAVNSGNALTQQGNEQSLATRKLTYPYNQMSDLMAAQTGLNQANAVNTVSGLPRGVAATQTGYVGQQLLPAAQASKLFSRELTPGAVNYTDQADALGVSPYRQGAIPVQTEDYITLPNGIRYPSGKVIHSVTMPQPPISAAELAGARAGVGMQPSTAITPQRPTSGLMSTPPDDREMLTTPEAPMANQLQQGLKQVGGQQPTKTNPAGRGSVVDTSEGASARELTGVMARVEAVANDPKQKPSQRASAAKDLEKIRALLSKYYE